MKLYPHVTNKKYFSDSFTMWCIFT